MGNETIWTAELTTEERQQALSLAAAEAMKKAEAQRQVEQSQSDASDWLQAERAAKDALRLAQETNTPEAWANWESAQNKYEGFSKPTFIEWYNNGTGWYDAWRTLLAFDLEQARLIAEPGSIVLPVGQDPNFQKEWQR